MVGELQQVELLLALAPEAADPFETAGSVLQPVREQTDLRIRVAGEGSVVIDRQVAQMHEVAVLRE